MGRGGERAVRQRKAERGEERRGKERSRGVLEVTGQRGERESKKARTKEKGGGNQPLL